MLLPLLLAFRAEAWGIRPDTVDAISKWYGAIAVALSALALVGVAASLYYQAVQARVNQALALRTMQKDLMEIALADPETYSICFGAVQTVEGNLVFQRMAYFTLRLRHAADLLSMGEITECELRGEIVPSILSTEMGRRYWETARPYWVRSGRKGQERVHRIMDEEYFRVARNEKGSGDAQRPIPPATAAMHAFTSNGDSSPPGSGHSLS
ncbi:DUF6082 family protein [Micromonospora sp. NPDC048169]|uniref:DUF6082 family protein n=1 Tax=unclassified Micromonospora TaxID=2617518 RepID=UPI00340C44C9